MTEKKSQPSVSWSSGNISGSHIIVGDGNVMIHNEALTISPAELKKLKADFKKLKRKIEIEVPEDRRIEALQKADELQATVLDKKPSPSKMASIRNWFMKYAPGMAGAVTSVVVDPIVGKLVEAAGETVASEFKRKFG